MSKPGNRVRLTIDRPSGHLLDQFRYLSPPALADAMYRSGCMRDIKSVYTPVNRLVGTAVTVKAPTGDSLMVRKALEIAHRGDVIVVDARGDTTRALWGGNRSLLASSKGVLGLVIDGAVRDVEEARLAKFPIFARAVQPMASASVGPGEVNFPIACGGVVVNPGDIIVADEEGIAVISPADAEVVLAQIEKVTERDETWVAAILEGKGSQLDEVDQLLELSGSEILG
ncbi:MAG TPA: RraA family protein [Chloroflexota bacterium]|nr:RraA family protein [Chloroflexota bacterium]